MRALSGPSKDALPLWTIVAQYLLEKSCALWAF